jgi:hypothetical protein
MAVVLYGMVRGVIGEKGMRNRTWYGEVKDKEYEYVDVVVWMDGWMDGCL